MNRLRWRYAWWRYTRSVRRRERTRAREVSNIIAHMREWK